MSYQTQQSQEANCQLTSLRFKDISEVLQKGNYNIKIDNVVRGVLLTRRNKHRFLKDSKSYSFLSDKYKLKEIVFTNDEIIEPNHEFDIIIQKILRNNPGVLPDVDCQVYHDLNPGERLTVRISRRDSGDDPSFKIFKYISGFVRNEGNPTLYNQLKVGSIVIVEVLKVIRAATIRINCRGIT